MTPFSRLCLYTFAIGSTLSVCACGQKGRLVIPTKPAAISTPYPTALAKPDDAVKPNATAPEEPKALAPANPGSLFDNAK